MLPSGRKGSPILIEEQRARDQCTPYFDINTFLQDLGNIQLNYEVSTVRQVVSSTKFRKAEGKQFLNQVKVSSKIPKTFGMTIIFL